MAEYIFHHDHGAVDEDAKVHGANGKQIGRGVLEIKADKREQEGERNGGGDDQPGAKIVKEEDQYHDNQQHAAQKVALDDLGGQRDQVTTIIKRVHFDILGQDLIV